MSVIASNAGDQLQLEKRVFCYTMERLIFFMARGRHQFDVQMQSSQFIILANIALIEQAVINPPPVRHNTS